MKNETLQNNFKKGVSTLCILTLLQREDMYGYQMVQAIAEEGKGLFLLPEGTLYPVLYRLQDQGYISDRKVLVGKRMTRVYYHLEPSGERYLAQIRKEYDAISAGVQLILKNADKGDLHAEERKNN